jgi:hypothetical protein
MCVTCRLMGMVHVSNRRGLWQSARCVAFGALYLLEHFHDKEGGVMVDDVSESLK